MPDRSRTRSLTEIRDACTHPCAIEVKHAASGIFQRFCLMCGEREVAGSLAAAKVVRTKSCETKKAYYRALAIYEEYLYKKGLFEKFDAEGRWLGGNGQRKVSEEE